MASSKVHDMVQAMLESMGELTFETVSAEAEQDLDKLELKLKLKAHVLPRIMQAPASFDYEWYQYMPRNVLERCFGKPLATKLINEGHIKQLEDVVAPASTPQATNNRAPSLPAHSPRAAKKRAPSPLAHSPRARKPRIQSPRAPYNRASPAPQPRASNPQAWPPAIPQAPHLQALDLQASHLRAGAPVSAPPTVSGLYRAPAQAFPATRATRAKQDMNPALPKFLRHPTSKFCTHQDDLDRARSGGEPIPRCRYKYASEPIINPAIRYHCPDGSTSSGYINLKLISNNEHTLWSSLGKLSPGHCYDWRMNGRCSHGPKCVWRHIKLSPIERADQAYWNPVLLAYRDKVDAGRKQATSEFTQWFPDEATCLHYIEGYQPGQATTPAPTPATRQSASRASSRATPSASQARRDDSWR